MLESTRDYIKLASINLLGYGISYIIKSLYFSETTNILGYESLMWDNIILSIIFTTYIFIFSYWLHISINFLSIGRMYLIANGLSDIYCIISRSPIPRTSIYLPQY